jgi:hypothetical protein
MSFGFVDLSTWDQKFGISEVLFSLEMILVECDKRYSTLQSVEFCEKFQMLSLENQRSDPGIAPKNKNKMAIEYHGTLEYTGCKEFLWKGPQKRPTPYPVNYQDNHFSATSDLIFTQSAFVGAKKYRPNSYGFGTFDYCDEVSS